MFKAFRIPILITIAALVASFFFGGVGALVTVAILTVLEISFSFDNAVVNAKILERMSAKWQKLFLTVGILIAVFGMRLVFPLLIVALATGLGPIGAVHMAVNDPHQYAHYLHLAHPAIAAFGGTFLGMLFLDWLFEKRSIHWLKPIEKTLAKVGKLENISIVVVLAALLVAAETLGHYGVTLFAGVAGLATYLLVSSLDSIVDEDKAISKAATAGLGTFLYLEVLDASFSFDGVIGAFAITSNIFLIALGLGIGALYIRSMTVELVKAKTLDTYRYLEHGAHWAIGTLAVMLFLTIKFDIPDWITGLIGVILIGASFAHSVYLNKKEAKARRAKRAAQARLRRAAKKENTNVRTRKLAVK